MTKDQLFRTAPKPGAGIYQKKKSPLFTLSSSQFQSTSTWSKSMQYIAFLCTDYLFTASISTKIYSNVN